MSFTTSLISEILSLPVELADVGDLKGLPSNLDPDYLAFISRSNGGYTADHYMHFFGTRGPVEHNIFEWNDPKLWKHYYGMGRDTLSFAEDIFGNQYFFDLAQRPATIKLLMVDDGVQILCSPTFEDFVEDYVLGSEIDQGMRALAADFFSETESEYQMFSHLTYKHPILLGGSDSDVSNIEVGRPVVQLKILGQITSQVKHIPKGTVIKKVLVDHSKMQIKLIY